MTVRQRIYENFRCGHIIFILPLLWSIYLEVTFLLNQLARIRFILTVYIKIFIKLARKEALIEFSTSRSGWENLFRLWSTAALFYAIDGYRECQTLH